MRKPILRKLFTQIEILSKTQIDFDCDGNQKIGREYHEKNM
jgi:hypothetical protein